MPWLGGVATHNCAAKSAHLFGVQKPFLCAPPSREELLKTWRIEYVACKLFSFHRGNK